MTVGGSPAKRPLRASAIPNQEKPYDEIHQRRRAINRKSKALIRAENLAYVIAASVGAYLANLKWALQEYGYGYVLSTCSVNRVVLVDKVPHESSNRIPFYLLFISILGFILVFFYLFFYIPIATGQSIDVTQWQTQAKRPVQIATTFGVLAFISSNWLLWPAYKFLTPLLVTLLTVGFFGFVGLF